MGGTLVHCVSLFAYHRGGFQLLGCGVQGLNHTNRTSHEPMCFPEPLGV